MKKYENPAFNVTEFIPKESLMLTSQVVQETEKIGNLSITVHS